MDVFVFIGMFLVDWGVVVWYLAVDIFIYLVFDVYKFGGVELDVWVIFYSLFVDGMCYCFVYYVFGILNGFDWLLARFGVVDLCVIVDCIDIW